MKMLIHYWYRFGAVIGIILLLSVFCGAFNYPIQRLLAINLICLFAHQVEEYQLPGGAPVIINRVVYNETTRANHYPGNSLSIMIVNTSAWIIYALSIYLYHVTWLGLGVILFSLFQILGHCLEMPLKLRAWYNPGMLTTLLLFLPVGIIFIHQLASDQLLTSRIWMEAVAVLIACILITIVLPVQSLKDEQTKYPIDPWQVRRYQQIMRHCQIRGGK